jgi:hypothetical protein
MTERINTATQCMTSSSVDSGNVSFRNRRTSVEVLIGRLLWGALFVVVMWVGAN